MDAHRPALIVAILALLSACAPVRGFPDDPATTSEYGPYFGPASEADYDARGIGDADRRTIRDRIVRQRLEGYAATYSDFKRRLTLDRNAAATGGSILALALGTAAATVRGDEAARILAAVSAGIVGAQGIVDRELYFRQTLPALIAQMDAARDRVLAAILTGLTQPVTVYTLAHANTDLRRLGDIGSIEGAINTINREAAEARAAAQAVLEFTRDPAYVVTLDRNTVVQTRIATLTPVQVLALANAMIPRLSSASERARRTAQVYLPATGSFSATQRTRAGQFVRTWTEYETMTPDREAIWMSAIEAIVKP